MAWGDEAWRKKRHGQPVYTAPLNIYEVHLGSWRRRENGDFIDYRDLARQLAPYVKDMGFNFIELLPEHVAVNSVVGGSVGAHVFVGTPGRSLVEEIGIELVCFSIGHDDTFLRLLAARSSRKLPQDNCYQPYYTPQSHISSRRREIVSPRR